MEKDLRINIQSCPSPGGSWGTFVYASTMWGGPFYLKAKPEKIFEIGDITILRCLGKNSPCDEYGVASSELYDFIVGLKNNGEVIWWHHLKCENDGEVGKNVECSISLEKNQIIVKGYAHFELNEGKTIFINIETGEKIVK